MSIVRYQTQGSVHGIGWLLKNSPEMSTIYSIGSDYSPPEYSQHSTDRENARMILFNLPDIFLNNFIANQKREFH